MLCTVKLFFSEFTAETLHILHSYPCTHIVFIQFYIQKNIFITPERHCAISTQQSSLNILCISTICESGLDGAVISAVSQLCLHGNEVDNFHMKMVVAICTQVFAQRKQNIEKLPNEKKRKRTGGREKGIEGERERKHVLSFHKLLRFLILKDKFIKCKSSWSFWWKKTTSLFIGKANTTDHSVHVSGKLYPAYLSIRVLLYQEIKNSQVGNFILSRVENLKLTSFLHSINLPESGPVNRGQVLLEVQSGALLHSLHYTI